jgi:endogenous inhibitor of DNA gyrase (YacG/DUF329 family)
VADEPLQSVANDSPSPAGKPCPICGRPAQTRFRPFCSGRCADVDLGRWLNGSYALPVADDSEAVTEDDQPG